MDCLADTGLNVAAPILWGAVALVATGCALVLAVHGRRVRRTLRMVAAVAGALLVAASLMGASSVPIDQYCPPPNQSVTPPAPPPSSPTPTPTPTPPPPATPTFAVNIQIAQRQTQFGSTIVSTTPVVLSNTSTVGSGTPLLVRVQSTSTLSTVTGFFSSPGVPDPQVTVVDDSNPADVLISIDPPPAAGQSLTLWVQITQNNLTPPTCPTGFDDGQPFTVSIVDTSGTVLATDHVAPPGACEA